MTKAIPKIEKYMTTTPHTISPHRTLYEAKKMMQELEVRHLPVLDGGKIVGILSDKDIDFLAGFKDVDVKLEKIDQAMENDPVVVAPSAELDEVCREMASRKIGSVLVSDNHKIVGIFTWIDALNAMNELLHSRLK